MASNNRPQRDGFTSESDAFESRPGQLTQVTRAMIAIYKEQFRGAGPRPRATPTTPASDAVVCLPRGHTDRPLERALAEQGEHQRLRDMRLWFQLRR